MSPEPGLLAALAVLERRAPQALLGPALDLACGRGRHARLLASRGIAVDALDRDPTLVASLASEATALGLPIAARVADLELPGFALPVRHWSLIVVVNYLHRPLLGSIASALRPGGALFYETFTHAQASFGKPTNPDFLLGPGELRSRFAALEELSYFEGIGPGPAGRASLLAVRAQR